MKGYTVPKEIDFPRYNIKCSGENVILRGIFHVVSCVPLQFMLYRGNLDFFSDSVHVSCSVGHISFNKGTVLRDFYLNFLGNRIHLGHEKKFLNLQI